MGEVPSNVILTDRLRKRSIFASFLRVTPVKVSVTEAEISKLANSVFVIVPTSSASRDKVMSVQPSICKHTKRVFSKLTWKTKKRNTKIGQSGQQTCERKERKKERNKKERKKRREKKRKEVGKEKKRNEEANKRRNLERKERTERQKLRETQSEEERQRVRERFRESGRKGGGRKQNYAL